MEYRVFPRTDVNASLLGMGCMRLPTNEDGTIDEPRAIEMIRYAIDHGVTYVDTAYGYHDGKSEVLVGKALRDGYRERVTLTTKLPVWLVKTFLLLMPIVSTLITFVLFGERMVGTQYLGMAVVIAGALGILLEQKQPQKK